ncbi:MFS transporter [Candidatus Bandiella euplotis]|uniref:MFS transporter n=1 Tax=Candidatus Bandiella euplotis TaxID=1664265 RepID=A0ABZ0UMD3_9RICK|nr:MFS transporter [Candidatus Bandiella woodruffii]WPX97299.1 MFS transporter [Candidatus Bandiella woodruffii]
MIFSKLQKKNIFCIVVFAVAVFDLAIFFYLPLLSSVRQEFKVSQSLIQFSAAVNLLGISISSIVYGTLSDAWGRRKIVLFGMLSFTIASYGISLATSIYTLFFFRFLQGVGAGVAWSIGNAIIHDIYKEKDFQKAIISFTIMMGIVTVISPSLGGYVGGAIGWRQSFNVMAISGLAILMYSIFFLPETLQTKSKINFQHIFNNYRTLFTNYTYIKHLIIKVLMVSLAFVNISNLPLIFVEGYQSSVEWCGALMALGSAVFVLGGVINGRLVNYFSTDKIIKYSLLSSALSSLTLISMEWFGLLTAIGIQIIKIPYLIAIALIFGNATSKVVSAIPQLSGSASASMVTLEALIGAFFVKLVSNFYNQTIYPMEIFALAAVVISYLTLTSSSIRSQSS